MLLDDWIEDLPQQFKNKNNIYILVKALAKQLQEIEDTFGDIDNLTIETATGKNLDYIGTIIPVTRKEAATILKSDSAVTVDDATYRNILQYEKLKNTCATTYDDIMQSVSLLTGTENITYEEPEDEPATIHLNIEDVDIDGQDPYGKTALLIKPAGVSLLYEYSLLYSENISGLETVELADTESIYPFVFVTPIDSTVSTIINVDFDLNESTTATKLIWQRSNYMLDGTILMDGTAKLNAYYYEEEV